MNKNYAAIFTRFIYKQKPDTNEQEILFKRNIFDNSKGASTNGMGF